MPGKSPVPSLGVNSSVYAIPLSRDHFVKDIDDAAHSPVERTLPSMFPIQFAQTRVCLPCALVPLITTSPEYGASHLATNCSAWQSPLIRTPPIHGATSLQPVLIHASYPAQPVPVRPVSRVRVSPAQPVRVAENGGDNVA